MDPHLPRIQALEVGIHVTIMFISTVTQYFVPTQCVCLTILGACVLSLYLIFHSFSNICIYSPVKVGPAS